MNLYLSKNSNGGSKNSNGGSKNFNGSGKNNKGRLGKIFINRLKRMIIKNWSFAKMAIITNMEYRFNFFIDIFIQPIVGSLVELTLWLAVFSSISSKTIGGFTIQHYLSYVIWAAFISRITTNWMYEFKMVEDIEKGTLNTLLLRPISFFETYLSQFLGYKFMTTAFSLFVPILVVSIFQWPMLWERIPVAFILIFYYLIFAHLISFIVATISFHYTKVISFSVAKNILLWTLSGEFIPMDLFPKAYIYPILIHLPFANGVYIPVGFLTGRFSWDVLWLGFISTTLGILAVSPLAYWCWKQGLKVYTGTGA